MQFARRMKRFATDALVLLAYMLVLGVFFRASTPFWFPVAGLRFVVLTLVPSRLFWPVLLAEPALVYGVNALVPDQTIIRHPDAAWLEALRCFAIGMGLHIYRRLQLAGRNRVDQMLMIRSLAVMFLTAALTSACDMSFASATMMDARGWPMYFSRVLGNYIGVMMTMPSIAMVFRPYRRPHAGILRKWRRDIPLVLLPMLVVSGLILFGAKSYQSYYFASGLCLVTMTYMSFRAGWRGASITLTGSGLLIALVSRHNGQDPFAVEIQMYLATTGTLGLVFGAALDTLRDTQRTLQASNALLARKAEQLRETARRNLSLSEDVRRWITSELHDELGQNLSALQVRLKVSEGVLEQDGIHRPDLFGTMRDIVQQMRLAVSGLMASLRPAGLEAFGLHRALQGGAVRNLVELAGIDYALHIHGDAKLLDRLEDDAQTAVYRIVPESATNTVRHSGANRFLVQFRLRAQADGCNLVLRCADDGEGIHPHDTAHIGLVGIADRALSFGGHSRVRSGQGGTRVLATMRLPWAAAQDHVQA